MNQFILNFHGVGNPPTGCDGSEIKYWLEQTQFEHILDTVCAEITEHDLDVKITFDDGNLSDAEIAFPALAERGLSATFFVCAGRIGKPGFLDSKALLELVEGGMSIGSHGMNHVDWRATNKQQLHAEITEANVILQHVCERPIREVAVPFGSYDRRVMKKLRSEGFQTVYTSDGGSCRGHHWIKPRNTLDRSFSGRNLFSRLRKRDTPAARLYRRVRTVYKSLR